MTRAISVILSVTLIILAGCGGDGDEDQGTQNPLVVPNPLQIEISMVGEENEVAEESSPVGSITGRIIFTDNDGQIQAYPLASYEYVIPEGSSNKVSGKSLILFVDFPSNNSTYLMAGGYFQITNVEPGTHELILIHEAEVIIMSDSDVLPENSYTEIDVPASQWTVTVEPDRNTTMGSLIIPVPDMPPDLEWKSGEGGEEVIVPEEPEPPVEPPVKPPVEPPIGPTNPTKPLMNPGAVMDGHVYLMDDAGGGEVTDDSANDNTGIIVGDPQVVVGLGGTALNFDGIDDGVDIPDSDFINITNGPWPNRTIITVFNCADVSKPEKQTIFEEGGRTRGLVIYVFDAEVYVGGWNRAEYDWNPGSWISAPIRSGTWYSVALVIRDGAEAVDDDRFEMWLNGQLIGKEPGGHIYNHANNNAIGYTNENAVFHDDDGSGDGWYFEGLVDEVWILNQALTQDDLRRTGLGVERTGKLASAWGDIKTRQ